MLNVRLTKQIHPKTKEHHLLRTSQSGLWSIVEKGVSDTVVATSLNVSFTPIADIWSGQLKVDGNQYAVDYVEPEPESAANDRSYLFDADPNTCKRIQSTGGNDAAERIDLKNWYRIDAVQVWGSSERTMREAEHMSYFKVNKGNSSLSSEDVECGVGPEMEAKATSEDYLQDFLLYCKDSAVVRQVEISVAQRDSMYFDLCEMVIYGAKQEAVNECDLDNLEQYGLQKCHELANCTDTQYSYTCECSGHYVGDGVTECAHADCLGKGNNTITAGDCFTLYTCINGDRIDTTCSGALPWAHPTQGICVAEPPSGCDAECTVNETDPSKKIVHSCFGYYVCEGGVKNHTTCDSNNPWYDTDNESCSANPPSGCDAECLNKTNGEKNADGCFGYFVCDDGVKNETANCTDSNNPWFDPVSKSCGANPPSGCDADCLDKTDGEKNEVDCFGYFVCNDGVKTETNCTGNNPWYEPVSKLCSAIPPSGCDADCLGKTDGEKNENGCFGYYVCDGGVKTAIIHGMIRFLNHVALIHLLGVMQIA